MKKSTVIRQLTNDEIAFLKEELHTSDMLWKKHFPILLKTSLRDGKSIHLQYCNHDLEIEFELWSLFPRTRNLLSTFVNLDEKLGRVYWHRLLQNEQILSHNDSNLKFVSNGKLLHRYQIYLDLDEKMTIIIDGKIANIDELKNSIIDFQLCNNHYYKNSSFNPLYILVFDITI